MTFLKYLTTAFSISIMIFSCGHDGGPGVIPQIPTPTDVVATAREGAVDITWKGIEKVQFKVYYGLNSGLYDGTDANEGISPIIIPEGSTSFSLSGLTNGNTYYIVLSAFTAAKEGEISTETFATPLGNTLVSPESLALQCEEQKTVDNAASLNVYDIGLGSKYFSIYVVNADWLIADPSDIIVPDTVDLDLDCTGLSPGSYSAQVAVSGGGEYRSIPVNLTVVSSTDAPFLEVFDNLGDPLAADIYFTCVSGQLTLAAKDIKIANTGGSQINFTSSSDNSFVDLVPGSGAVSSLSQLDAQIQADCYMISAGNHESVLTIEAPGVYGSPFNTTVHITAMESELDPPDNFDGWVQVLSSTCYFDWQWSWDPPAPETVAGYVLFIRSVHTDGDWVSYEYDADTFTRHSAARRSDTTYIYDGFIKAKYASGLSGPSPTVQLICPAN